MFRFIGSRVRKLIDPELNSLFSVFAIRIMFSKTKILTVFRVYADRLQTRLANAHSHGAQPSTSCRLGRTRG